MSSNKRGRGRPRGTGLNDAPTLRKVADMLTADPALKPTRAIKRILDTPSETTVRRLQGKWRTGRTAYLADAEGRRAAQLVPVRRATTPYSPRTARHLLEAHQKMQEALRPSMRVAQELATSRQFIEAQETARRFQENPALRAARELANSPAFLAVQEATRRINEDPTMRAMRELQESPTMRAVREAQAQMHKLIGGF